MTKKTNTKSARPDEDVDLEAAAETAGRYARKLLDESPLAEGADGVLKTIHEKPIQAALIALGVGFVLGAILRRS